MIRWRGPPSFANMDPYRRSLTLWTVVVVTVAAVALGFCPAVVLGTSTTGRSTVAAAFVGPSTTGSPRRGARGSTGTPRPASASGRRPNDGRSQDQGPTPFSWISRSCKLGWGKVRRTFQLRALSPSSSSCSSSSSSPSSKMKQRRLYSFDEARNMARQYGFTSQVEYVAYECPGAYQLPKNPHEVYAAEWAGWDDYLGLPWTYTKGRELARTLQLHTAEQYLECWQSPRVRNDPNLSRLPYRPDLYYAKEDDDGCSWIGWDDWLGITASIEGGSEG